MIGCVENNHDHGRLRAHCVQGTGTPRPSLNVTTGPAIRHVARLNSKTRNGRHSDRTHPYIGLSEEALRGRRLALLQTALLEHAAAHNLHTIMTFHHRVEEAAAFAAKLPETAADLYADKVPDRAAWLVCAHLTANRSSQLPLCVQ
ncbi:hypothetical protein FCI23_52070 [Actinacidiphila oryziradicis]|uniref:Uncharacterized protein n=1 Tax=Actinacidiphila oryziradicis TaxID=2571141 RepID=A0A4U0RII3_9ACTN|nr:hypothetical protein [Actinacidiphila oryziradicis]TJZ95493.1 hypothetical protein FCI23_52070 [Actinacidiphila oryziradicis]